MSAIGTYADISIASAHVRYWHKADMREPLIDVRFWGECVAKLF
jgi:hypothetical protein